MAVLATEDYQPLLDTAREKGMTARYVWVTLDSAKGALISDGILMFSRQATVAPALKAFRDSWKADTTIYNKTLHGAFNSTTRMPLYDPNGPFWDTDYADVGDGMPDEWVRTASSHPSRRQAGRHYTCFASSRFSTRGGIDRGSHG